MGKKRLSYDMFAQTIKSDNDTEEELFTDTKPVPSKGQRFDINAMLFKILDDELTKKQKCYIILYYRDGLTVNEIAGKFGVDKSTVSRTINRGRKKLANCVKREALRRIINNI